MKRTWCLLLFVLLVCSTLTYANEPKSRNLDFEVEVTLNEIPQDTSELKIWIPHVAQTPYQEIEEVKITPEENATITYDKTYNNKIIHYSIKSPKESSLKLHIFYKVKRFEYSNTPENSNGGNHTDNKNLEKYLMSNHLVPLNTQIKEMASEVTLGKDSTIAKARAIYDYVYDNLTYNKEIPGWGKGDTVRVCLVKSGNCTDFHSLFIALVRANDIPAKFVIGVPLKDEMAGEYRSYHCWAEFYDEQLGWIPVDISEAWKDETKKEYYFGSVSEDRVEFTRGRDIILEPEQMGEPLNYFFFPYVEVDGREFKNSSVIFKYKNREEKG